MSTIAAFKLSLMDLCWRSNIPIDCGRYKAEYWTLMCSLSIMSFQRLLMKEAPLSDVTTAGTPNKANQWCKNPVAASEDEASLSGMHWRNLVERQMAVSIYLYP